MSSDQTSKPPAQAGRFKPRKPASRKPTTIAKPTDSATASERVTTSMGREKSAPSSRVQGRGRGGRGRGRFAVPKGQVFFTGSAAANAPGGKKTSVAGDKNSGSAQNGTELIAKQELVIIPGMGSTTGDRTSVKGSSDVGKTAQERMAASALARSGEGEELIVGEMDEGSGVGDGKKKRSILDSSQNNEYQSSLFDTDEVGHVELSADAFTYDSESSTDGDTKRASSILNQRKRKDGVSRIPILPQQLPIPPTRKSGSDEIEFMYRSQLSNSEADKKQGSTEISSDPPLRAPFIDLQNATAEQKKEEQLSWMVFKFPTRLPRLDLNCIASSGKIAKMESTFDLLSPDVISSGIDTGDISAPPQDIFSSSSISATPTTSSDQAAVGYDDTLKDTTAGRYGKIVVHKSGKAYLIVGGDDSKTPHVKMLLSEGLTCGFLQQAVVIDANQSSYTPLGEVKKSLVVTPDVETAFEM
mmetsp:Transcript_17473/g.33123  ORF Transcript_17473/g.33123 Transcript_17473/m.33123 type:complete len:471 (-) Transcript_17473:68-1480(-)